MKTQIWQTTYGGVKRTHCIIIIEEIKVTDPKDIKKILELDDQNRHNDASKIAAKYTDNQLFKDMVNRIEELNKKGVPACMTAEERAELAGHVFMTDEEIAEHQALIAFTKHFKITY